MATQQPQDNTEKKPDTDGLWDGDTLGRMTHHLAKNLERYTVSMRVSVPTRMRLSYESGAERASDRRDILANGRLRNLRAPALGC
jgi:hypothetical protein